MTGSVHRQSIARGLVLDAVDAMTAELTIYVHHDLARERARNIALVLSDGGLETVPVVCSALEALLEDRPFLDRVLAISRTSEAWDRSVERHSR